MVVERNSQDILNNPLSVISLGVDMFADALTEQGVKVIYVDWRPPMPVAEEAYALLPLLED